MSIKSKLLFVLSALAAGVTPISAATYTLQNSANYSGCVDTYGESFTTDNSASTIIKVEN